MTFAPLTSRVLQRALRFRALQEFACESMVVCAAESERMRPALYLPGEIEQIRGVHEFSAGLQDEIHLATRDRVEHTETMAYRLRNVALANGRICNFRSYRTLTFERRPIRVERLPEIADCVALCSTDAGNDYFAHFILDDIGTALLGRNYGHIVFANTGAPRTGHVKEYLETLEILHQDLSTAFFRDLWLFKDYPQNSHRRGRLRDMRAMLRARAGAGRNAAAPAYIRRGASGRHRILENESEIEALLVANGFTIVDPEIDSLEQISAKLNGSPLVIGVEGSQMAHGLLHLADDGILLCIQPAARFNAVFRGFTNTVGLSWAFVVADGGPGHFRLNGDRLLATVDLAMARGGQC